MSYGDTCGSVKCRNAQIAAAKQNRTQDQWDAQRAAFRVTMGAKTNAERQSIVTNRIDTYNSKHNIDHRLQQQVDPESLKLLQDRDWMYGRHISQKCTAVKIAEELGVGVTTATNWLHRHNIPIQRYRSSQVERDIVQYITSLDPTIVIKTNNRTIISPDEIDIVLPEYNIGIEVNGVYWHGELNGKGRRYHLSKSERCIESGIRLIHILDTEWITQQDIVKSRLKAILGYGNKVHARKCKIVELTTSAARSFLIDNHIQGYSGNICYGLEYGDELVAVMTFGVPRFNNNHEYELIRFANKINTNVVGGASRLFKYFQRQKQPLSVISYSDNRWNTGNLYVMLGFSMSHTSTPNYKYFHTNNPLKLYGRYQFQKHKLSRMLDTFDSSMSEWENMARNGYDRIWDCGNAAYSWTSLPSTSI